MGETSAHPARLGSWLLALLLAVLLTSDARNSDWARELAELRDQLAQLDTDLEKTTFLREYVGGLLDIGHLDRRAAPELQGLSFRSFDPAAFYPLFAGNRLPADCGLTTFFYIKLLQAFGFDAYQYSFGFTDAPFERYVHSVVLVNVSIDGRPRLIVQDPYLNLTILDRNGQPLGFFAFLDHLVARRFDDIVISKGSVRTNLLVPDPDRYLSHLSPVCRTAFFEFLVTNDGTLARLRPIDREYALLMRSPCDDFEGGFVDALRQHGIEAPFLFGYTLQSAAIVGSDGHEGIQRRIDTTLAGDR